MKKILLAILAFLTLTAFDIQKLEAPGIDNVTKEKTPRGIDRPIAMLLSPADGKLTVKQGQPIKFSATASGRPIPQSTVRFMSSGSISSLILENSDRITITKRDANVSVTIKNAEKSDSGIYEIFYVNRDGYATVSLFVEIEEEPTRL